MTEDGTAHRSKDVPVEVTEDRPASVTTPPPGLASADLERRVVDDSPPWGVTTKAIVASVVILLTALVVWRFDFLIRPLVVAAVLAYLLNPLIAWFERKVALSRGHAVLLVYGALAAGLIAAGVLIGIVATDQIVRLSRFLPESLSEFFADMQARLQLWAAVQWQIGPYTIDFAGINEIVDLPEIVDQLRATLQATLARGGALLASLAQATLSTIGTGLVVLVVSIYIAIDAPKLVATIGDLAQQPGYRADAERLVSQTLVIWNAYLRGQVVLAVIIFTVVSILLSLLQVSNALALGVIAGLMEFLPIIGPILSSAAAVTVALFQTSIPYGLSPLTFALIVLAAMIFVQQVENSLLVPNIVGDALDLHPIVVTVSVLMGTSLAGLLGAVLAAPVAASLKLYSAYVWRKMLDLPPFPPELPDGSDAVASRPGWTARLQAWVRGMAASDHHSKR